MENSNMQKKGQATIFVILGIVLIVIIGLFLYLGSESLPGIIRPADFSDVEETIQNCIDDTLVKAKDSLSSPSNRNVIEPDDVKDVIESYFYTNMNCVDQVRINHKSFDLVMGGVLLVEAQIVGSSVNDLDKIVVTVDLPLIVSKGEEQERFGTFVSELELANG